MPAPHSVLREIGPDMLAPFAVTLALALLVAMILSGQVSKPLYDLRRTIEAIGKGDFDAGAAAPASSGKEFVEMGAAISAMAAGLRERDTIKRASPATYRDRSSIRSWPTESFPRSRASVAG